MRIIGCAHYFLLKSRSKSGADVTLISGDRNMNTFARNDGIKVSSAQEFITRYQRFKAIPAPILIPTTNASAKSLDLEVCFVLSNSLDLEPWVEGCSNWLPQVVSKNLSYAEELGVTCNLKTSIVAYNVIPLLNYSSRFVAGNDELLSDLPVSCSSFWRSSLEATSTAVSQALALPWSSDRKKCRFIVLIAGNVGDERAAHSPRRAPRKHFECALGEKDLPHRGWCLA
eukprot:TRINITY_DN628_c0_g1_i1.p1 TRINITY_DN628_c0_g1~~TRINITY_DN628_c0_g1_i1.p1  ORF type:complete len:228 (+),score=14.32 TRINITY_DN628_c0_g1_i1:134-817(+)